MEFPFRIDVPEFLRLAGGPQSNLAAAALAFSRLEYPRLTAAPYLDQLDEMGRAASRRLSSVGSNAPVRTRVEILNRYLYQEQGFAGNQEHYDDPRNSFLNEVLERRTGIPISLAVVYMEVARRAGLPVEGVNFPGHFLLRCCARADDQPQDELILDPFNAGTPLSEIDCHRLLQQHVGDKIAFRRGLLAAATTQQVLVRMLVNLKRIYVRNRSFPQAMAVTELLLAIDPAAITELRDRGLLAYHLGKFSLALQDLESYLTLTARQRPEGEETAKDREQIWEHVKTLRRRVAGFNYFPVKNAPCKSFMDCSVAGRSVTDRAMFISRDGSECARILLDVID